MAYYFLPTYIWIGFRPLHYPKQPWAPFFIASGTSGCPLAQKSGEWEMWMLVNQPLPNVRASLK